MPPRFTDLHDWFIVGEPAGIPRTKNFEEAVLEDLRVQFEAECRQHGWGDDAFRRSPVAGHQNEYSERATWGAWQAYQWCMPHCKYGDQTDRDLYARMRFSEAALAAHKVASSRLHEADQPGVLRVDDGVVSEFKPLRVAPSEIAPALEFLRDHQGRVDEEGVDCIVSRQAVFEVLRYFGMLE